MPAPLLSVVLPVYAGTPAAELHDALESLVGQTRPAEEIVLVEDGPLRTEHRAVIDDASGRLPLRPVVLTKQGGISQALQAGLEAARGLWVARMDADDIALPERFEVQLRAVADDGIDVLGAAMYEFESDPERPTRLRVMPTDHQQIARLMRRANPINHPTVVMRRATALAAGGYQTLDGLEDYDLWARLLRDGARMGNLRTPVLLFRAAPAMYRRRRHGVRLRTEIALQRNLYRYGLIGPFDAVANTCLRSALRVLPSFVLRRVSDQMFGERVTES